MLLLINTNDTLKLATSSSQSVDVRVDYAILNQASVTPSGFSSQRTTITTSGQTVILGSPPANTTYNVVELSVRLSAAATRKNAVKVLLAYGATEYEVYSVTLSAGDTLSYVQGMGWDIKRITSVKRVVKAGGGPPENIPFTTVPVVIAFEEFDISVGDVIRVLLNGSWRNDSGATRTLTLMLSIGQGNLSLSGSTTIASATDAAVVLVGYIAVHSTSLARMALFGASNPASTDGASASMTARMSWNVASFDLTGRETIGLTVRSSGAGSQVFRSSGYVMEQLRQEVS